VLGQRIVSGREYELTTEAHAQLSVVGNCSRFSVSVYCLPSPLLPQPPATADHPHLLAVSPSPEHTLEQFPMTES
jgi:hypothetical protein